VADTGNFATGQERFPQKNAKKRIDDSGSYAKGGEKLPRMNAIDRKKPGTFADTEGIKMVDSDNKGDPRVTSDTKGEEITPDNPETIKQFPVDLTDKKAVKKVEGDQKEKK